ncbi:MAG: T9SS type A sorting domain-containing protein [candidate division KSB1 bacterium]|nr:T9SS type A sorting domain-containing protein [candidate division KSB1 bacterium]
MSKFILYKAMSKIVAIVLLMLILFSSMLLGQPYYLSGGYGTNTQGGLNGKVIKVTCLNSDGPGSLRAACEASGERLVVFEVGGVIDLEKSSIKIKNPYITIAGQTAPSPGVTIIRGGLSVVTHDVVIQHLASRPGEAGEAKGSGWEVDGMSAYGVNAYNVVFDHCSVTWSTDENLSISGPPDSAPGESSHDVTLYGCLIAESLSHSTHSGGEHGKGTLLLEGITNVSIIGCLYAHNNRRNPFVKGNTRTVFVNNLIYNSGSQCIGMADRGKSPYVGKSHAVIMGNAWMTGPSSSRKVFVHGVEDRVCANVYFSDNFLQDRSGNHMELNLANIHIYQLNNAPLWFEGPEAKPASESISCVLRTAGARAADRDPVDQRIVQTVIDSTGAIIDSEQEVGGYPVYDVVNQPVEIPETEDLRRAWLDSLSQSIGTDTTLDLSEFESNASGVQEQDVNRNSFDYELSSYPNPFNPTTCIKYTLKSAEHVSVQIFNIVGRQVAMLFNGFQEAGQYQTSWYAGDNKSGLYFCRLRVGERTKILKLLLQH